MASEIYLPIKLSELPKAVLASDLKGIITAAESTFTDPTSLVYTGWDIGSFGSEAARIIVSRPVHTLSQIDIFSLKLLLILEWSMQISRELSGSLIASIIYADGNANLVKGGLYSTIEPIGECKFAPVKTEGWWNKELDKKRSHYPVLLQLLVNDGIGAPLSYDRAMGAIANVANLFSEPDRPQPIRKWLGRYTGKSVEPDDDSALFTTVLGPFHLPLGADGDTGNTIYYKGEASLLTVAPPGKGKTQCHILPTLASYRGPIIALDVKGECFDQTAEWRKENVGPVIRFNPVESEGSAAYNPLAFVNDQPDELWESARFLAELLVVPRSQTDPGWESQGKDLLTLIIAYVSAVEPAESRRMSAVLDLVATIGLKEMLGAVGDADGPFPSAMRRVAARLAQMASSAPKQFEGVLSGASQHLSVWEGPKLERVTARTDWRPDDFRQAPYPTLYLCIPPNALETYAPVLRVIIGQHVRSFMREQVKAEAPILLLLDELPQLGRMQPIREALEVGRSYGLKVWMIAQYPDQLINAYPGHGEGMMESCDVRMYMNPSLSVAERISKEFGKSESVFTDSVRALDPAQIAQPEYRDSIFVLASSEKPTILRKQFYYSRQ